MLPVKNFAEPQRNTLSVPQTGRTEANNFVTIKSSACKVNSGVKA